MTADGDNTYTIEVPKFNCVVLFNVLQIYTITEQQENNLTLITAG